LGTEVQVHQFGHVSVGERIPAADQEGIVQLVLQQLDRPRCAHGLVLIGVDDLGAQALAVPQDLDHILGTVAQGQKDLFHSCSDHATDRVLDAWTAQNWQ